MNKILYMHGFNSSPESHKARVLHDYMQRQGLGDHIDIPKIPPQPAAAIELLQQHADTITRDYALSLVGSSLGGFYATWLAEKYNCPAVLINPAVRPHELLMKYLGENRNYYTDENWVLDHNHITQFRELYIERVTQPERYLVLLQTGDDTLDYREALQKYAGCSLLVEQGGSHEFSGFERHLEKILSFCNVTPG
ncbi:MAG: YqiA/YcfP family alpha/beta fold hydrolase [Gammaproteobacteria bacterium]|jgi:predicted esterase YcpF (UPF0227 family)